MSDDEIDRMDVARHLLPPPGDAVAGQLIAEVRRLRLADEEREAVRYFSGRWDGPVADSYGATLRGMLERLGGDNG